MDVTWRKSSYSGGNGGNCIEVGAHPDTGRVLVRDTRDQGAPALRFTPRAWKRFADRVKHGGICRIRRPHARALCCTARVCRLCGSCAAVRAR